MSVKLFVTDLDGTLLPSGKDVPRENIEAVQKAVRAGVIVTIATGRMYRAALPVAEALGVDVPIITYNGALIKSTKGKVYHTSYLKPEVIEQVVDFCQEQAGTCSRTAAMSSGCRCTMNTRSAMNRSRRSRDTSSAGTACANTRRRSASC